MFMYIEDNMRERQGRVLAELAEVGMVMVRRLSEAMLRTEDVQIQAQIGLAFHRVSRAVRQTMALEFRLSQEARREVVAPRTPSPTPAHMASAAPTPPCPTPERVGWSEYERSDSDEALDALDELLDAENLDVAAVHEAVEASMTRLRRDLAADPLLVKAGVLTPDEPGEPGSALLCAKPSPAGPQPRNRRSELMGAASFAGPPLAIPPKTVPQAGLSIWRSSA